MSLALRAIHSSHPTIFYKYTPTLISPAVRPRRIWTGTPRRRREYSGNYYGTPIAGVEQAIARGKVCFLIIEVQGAKNVMRICPDCVSIFLYPPNFEILEQRLRGRMSETDEVIRNRLEIAKVELQSRDCYKYQVLNDDLDTAVHEINHIICDELAKRNAE